MALFNDRNARDRRRLVGNLSEPLTAVAFWAAIVLPIMYIPLLAAGLETAGELLIFLALFALHLASLFGGRSYGSR